MPRNIVQDVVPRNKRGIRDVPLPKRERPAPTIVEEQDVEEKYEIENGKKFHYSRKEVDSVDLFSGDSGRFPRWVIWIIGTISALVLIIVLGNFFSAATLTVTPRTQILAVDDSFVAKQKPATGELGYKIFSLTRGKSIAVPADGEQPVETRASGRIIIYNNYSTTPQRLIKNTRFETPDGLIFKINDSVTLPGKHTVSGKSVPGSLEVTVAAESAGDEYNIGLTDFTVPGFASNAERFKSFYGRSKTPMTGGKVGMEKTVSEEKVLRTRVKISTELADALVEEAAAHVPDDSIFYPGAYKIDFEDVAPVVVAKTADVAVGEKARLTAFFVKRNELAKMIAKNSLGAFDGVGVNVSDADTLVFKLKDSDEIRATSLGPITFSLKGAATAVWQFDENKLKTELVGKNKSDLPSIIVKYPSIIKASVIIKPFWKSEFPQSTSKIKITVAKSS